ncbi:putative ABC transport system permease protein [Sulfitobacter undariae]|uniref:Putative ABC transport system permease protein n=1 Tax=Sulfitobacter undariae TaxID=1563671 RepID=A0A7W6E1T1_9RHOB|nr:ABC transporter permease [Sulfitobacter undariae]MBB3993143.1 putative ABC transport system permease protein [Sulfitobacter undariae]
MSNHIKQTFIMSRANLFSLPRRLAISTSMVLSVALVVAVLAGFLAMSKGFEQALEGAGSSDIAVVLGGGTNQEMGSDIPADAIRNLQAMSGDFGVTRDAAGSLIASREIIVTIGFTPEADTLPRTLALRGMDASGPLIRDGVTLSDGRLFRPSAREIVVGARIAADFPGFEIGETVRLGALDWTVVGHFASNGSAFESEIWADLETTRAAFDRQGQVQSLRLRLHDASSLSSLNVQLQNISQTRLLAVSEANLYAAQAGRTADIIQLFGWPLALLMAIGATAGALNTMMSSVADRTVEIATLRALGFSRLSACLATWFEAIALACIGAVLGILASWLGFNGWQASTVGANNASIGFQLSVTGDVMLNAGLLGLAIGALGGAIPAFAATRLPLTAALRASG